jgi:probable addiction module antidote protein
MPKSVMKDGSARSDLERLIIHLNAGLSSGDTAHALAALGELARRHGMSRLAREMEVSRESLYSSLSSEGNPYLSTVVKALGSLGLSLTVSTRPANGRLRHEPGAEAIQRKRRTRP